MFRLCQQVRGKEFWICVVVSPNVLDCFQHADDRHLANLVVTFEDEPFDDLGHSGEAFGLRRLLLPQKLTGKLSNGRIEQILSEFAPILFPSGLKRWTSVKQERDHLLRLNHRRPSMDMQNGRVYPDPACGRKRLAELGWRSE
jgi:hypothetical protein